MKTLTILLGVCCLVASSQAQQHNSIGEGAVSNDVCAPSEPACPNYIQMLIRRDGNVLSADWICFYTSGGPPPNGVGKRPEDIRGSDEFFMVMDGRNSVMPGGKHPGIFVDLVKNERVPKGYIGYGPMHGGLDDVSGVKDLNQGAESVTTFDDRDDSFRFAKFQYCDRDPKGRFTGLCFYEQWEVQKSTGRFQQKDIHFGSTTESDSFFGQCIAVRDGYVKNTLADRARHGDDAALAEMKKSGDIRELRLLLDDPSYAGHEGLLLFLGRRGDREVLQYFACRTLTPGLFNAQDLIGRELDYIGGEFSIQVYRRWLDSDASVQPEIEEVRKGGGDFMPRTPSAWALIRLESLVPDSAIPKATPRQLLEVPMAGSEELKERWRVWIDSHPERLQKLVPNAEGIAFDADVCKKLKTRW